MMMRMIITMTNRNLRTYSELMSIDDFFDRFEYVKIGGLVGDATFGGNRWINQTFYNSKEWKDVRGEVILRDKGYDLGHEEYPIMSSVYVHHINPITIDDILNKSDITLNPEYLISTSFETHNALHYGSLNKNDILFAERKPNDTCLWR